MTEPSLPSLPHPSAGARLHKSGRQDRDRPILHEQGGERFGRWEVDVTPLVETTIAGRGIDSGRLRPRAVFEVRAAYYGEGLPAFGRQPNTRLIPTTHTEDEELALAIGRALVESLRSGNREIEIVAFANDVERRRAG